jgi:hypothetical protein
MSRPEAAIVDRSPIITEGSLARILKEDTINKEKEFL